MTTTKVHTGPGIRIILNGEITETSARTLAELIEDIGYAGARIATALNGVFVAAHARAESLLRGGDEVEIVAPRQGG
ncbi:MAG: sulfur carrier protein ThiS [Hyphomicrobiaceae bacterium]